MATAESWVAAALWTIGWRLVPEILEKILGTPIDVGRQNFLVPGLKTGVPSSPGILKLGFLLLSKTSSFLFLKVFYTTEWHPLSSEIIGQYASTIIQTLKPDLIGF